MKDSVLGWPFRPLFLGQSQILESSPRYEAEIKMIVQHAGHSPAGKGSVAVLQKRSRAGTVVALPVCESMLLHLQLSLQHTADLGGTWGWSGRKGGTPMSHMSCIFNRDRWAPYSVVIKVVWSSEMSTVTISNGLTTQVTQQGTGWSMGRSKPPEAEPKPF